MFITTLIITATMMINASVIETTSSIESPTFEMSTASQTVRFRSTQKLRARDGREIYFYSSGKCEGYDGDRLQFSTTYTIIDNEVRLLDERGNTVYKGTLSWREKGQSLYNVTIAGFSMKILTILIG